jgi:hypothetical protein
MSGSVGGTARVSVPAPPGTEPHPTLRLSGVVRLLAREPFVLLVVALDALVVSVLLPFLVRSDTWLALVGGRQVWSGGLPHHDTLTVWSYGVTWVDQQWLGQLFFYGIHAVGGLRLLLLVHAIVLVTAFTLALTFALRTGASPRSAGLVGVVALIAALPNSTVRTQALAYVLFVALFWLLASDAKGPSRRLFMVVPLLVLWANVHGSAVLGAGLVIVWAVAELLRYGRRADVWSARGRAVVLAAVAPLCLLASPYGLALAGYYHDVLGSSAFRDVVSEWRPATFPDQWPFFVLAVGTLWLAGRSRGKLSLFEQLALVATLFAALDTLRSIVWFALVTAMVVPRALDGLWPVGSAVLRRRVNLVLALGSLLVLVGAFGAAAAHPTGWYARDYPRGAVDAVSKATAHNPSLRVFANEAYADWLLWNVPGLEGRVAFDARLELLSSRQLHSLAHFRNRSTQDWVRAVDGYRLVVLDTATERPTIRELLRQHGTMVLYRDRHVAVLLRGAKRTAS